MVRAVILDIRRHRHTVRMATKEPILVELDYDGMRDCCHSRQSGALRLDATRTIVAFTICDDCGVVVRPLPAHAAEASSQACHQALIAAQQG
jgi:hypothetical protein